LLPGTPLPLGIIYRNAEEIRAMLLSSNTWSGEPRNCVSCTTLKPYIFEGKQMTFVETRTTHRRGHVKLRRPTRVDLSPLQPGGVEPVESSQARVRVGPMARQCLEITGGR
jgi:hypothetical protein